MAEAEARTHMRPWPTHTWTTISTSTYLLLLLLSYSCYYNNNNNNCYQLPNCCWCYFYCLTIKIATKYCCYWLYYKYLIATTIILPISGHVLLNCTYAMLQPNKLLIVVLVLLPIQFIMSITSLTPFVTFRWLRNITRLQRRLSPHPLPLNVVQSSLNGRRQYMIDWGNDDIINRWWWWRWWWWWWQGAFLLHLLPHPPPPPFFYFTVQIWTQHVL